ncbi:MAG: Bug family tripartite tricarboxylate transporter substrate binding protein [Janthinobacterium lividum]
MTLSNHPSRRFCLQAIAAAALMPGGMPAGFAQDKIARIVVAFPPGGPVDFVARTLAQQLGKELGRQVIIENRAGANGTIAAEYVSRAAPDAQTLWLTSVGAVAINPSLYEKLPYDPVKDLTPVSLIVRNVEVLVVAADAPYSTGAEFVAAAKKSKTPLTLASSGTGSVPHLAMELLADAAKTPMLHVPYKGAAPAITDVIAGHVDGFFGDVPGLLPFIKGGKLKPIGIAASKRNPILPEVKTFEEMGIAGVDSDNWYGLFAAKGTPGDVLDAMNKAVRKSLGTESVRTRLLASGAEPAPSSPAELTALLARDAAKWSAVVRAKKIKPD